MTLAQLPVRRYHQGWEYTEVPTNKSRQRWVATYRGLEVTASSEVGLKAAIENAMERYEPPAQIAVG